MENQRDTRQQQGPIELLISCTDLADLDVFSKTDPMCVLFVKKFGQWKEKFRTEAVQNTLNPKFTESFVLDLDPDLHQPLMFSVYDIDSRSTDLKKHDHVGSIEVLLADLVQPDHRITNTSRSLRVPGDPHSRGMIHITAEMVQETRSRVTFHLGGHKLDKKGLLSMTKGNTFLEVGRSINSVNFHPVYRSEVVFKSQNPRWRPFEMSVQKLTNGDLDRPIQFSCWFMLHNDFKLIGACRTTLRDMCAKKAKLYQGLPLVKTRRKEKSIKQAGELRVLQCRLDMQYTVLDFIRGGCLWKFIIAIDFTSSNGDPGNPLSLHYQGGPTDNQYMEAIKTVGGLLSHYDLDQRFGAFGFGAVPSQKENGTKHCFPLNGIQDDPYVKGIEGVLKAYRDIVPRLKFSGPSVFTHVVKRAVKYIKSQPACSQQNQSYYVLMILTDGVVNDLDCLINAVIEASSLPLSVVVVGVGPADFSLLDPLHEEQPLISTDKKLKAVRETVHFTALRKNKYSTGANMALARESLAAVSRQFLDWMKLNDLSPNRPKLNRLKPLQKRIMDTFDQRTSYHAESVDEHTGKEIIMTPRASAKPESSRPSNRFTNKTDPTCPTCGALIESRQELLHLNGTMVAEDMVS